MGSGIFDELDPLDLDSGIWDDDSMPHWESEDQMRAALQKLERDSLAPSSIGSGSGYSPDSSVSLVAPGASVVSADISPGPMFRTVPARKDKEALKRVSDSKPSLAQKRARRGLSPVPTPSVPAPMSAIVAKTTILTNADRKVCLEEMIAAGDTGRPRIIARIARRLPQVDKDAFGSFVSYLYALTRVPIWFDDLLMSLPVGSDPEYTDIIEATTAMATSPVALPPLRRGVSRAVKDWMRFCIEPLRRPGAAKDQICRVYRTRNERECVELAGAQLRLFLEEQLASIDTRLHEEPRKSNRVKVRVRVVASSPGEDRTPAPTGGGTAPVQTREEKRVCLKVLAEDPMAFPAALAKFVTGQLPHLSITKVVDHYKHLISWARVPRELHTFLLTRNIVEWKAELIEDARIALGTRRTALRWGLEKHAEKWIRYCIVPLLLNNPAGGQPPCFSHDDGTGLAHLSLGQRQLLFADMLAEFGPAPAVTN